MRDENGRIVAPDSFIAAAERYGITPSIDRWVIENALRWLVSEADERERLAMCSINLSGQSLGDDKFLPYVIEQFHRSGLDATKICFEITETAAVASFSQANRFIQALKELGCKFALDDFGTGLSSFGYLKHFPVDYLKIDGSFVREILHDPIDREMVRSINEIGHLTGKQTIAEFAENAEIIQMLRNIGVDFAQGYGVAQPQRILKAVRQLSATSGSAIGQGQRAERAAHPDACDRRRLRALVGRRRRAGQRRDRQELAAPVCVLHRLDHAETASILEPAGIARGQSQRRAAHKALHATLDAPAVVRARDHFLPGIAALGERDRIDAVEVQHLRDELSRGRAVDLRQSGGDVERAPLLARQRGHGGGGCSGACSSSSRRCARAP